MANDEIGVTVHNTVPLRHRTCNPCMRILEVPQLCYMHVSIQSTTAHIGCHSHSALLHDKLTSVCVKLVQGDDSVRG